MPLSDENPPDPIRENAAEARRRLRESIHESLTEERLRDYWDRFQGVATRGPARGKSWKQEVTELWCLLLAAHIPQRLALMACIVFVGLVVWLQLMPRSGHFRTPEGLIANGGLPPTLRLNMGASRAELGGGR